MTSPTDTRTDAPDVMARRIRGIVLLLGAVVILALVQTEVIKFYWFPLITGLTYLTAAVAGRARCGLWAPGVIITTVGLAIALWLLDGRSVDSFQFLALAVMSLGLGGVIISLLDRSVGLAVTPMSISLTVLVFGTFLLVEQQGIEPIAGHSWFYAALLAVWGAFELRPVGSRD